LYFFPSEGAGCFLLTAEKGKMIQTKVDRRFLQPAKENVSEL
jgi:hypothetical protein